MFPIEKNGRFWIRSMKRTFHCVLISCSYASSLVHANTDDIGPFDVMSEIPSSVDAAAVFHNPADTILLSPVGRSMRQLLALGGVFTETEHAWDAFSRTFDAPVDETIRMLLSNQVAVVWDGMRSDQQRQGITNAFDSKWTLICKVDPKDLQSIRNSLKPVKRDIVHSRAVYAIEQGRYVISLINATGDESNATVLIAPRTGVDLLHAVLEHAGEHEQPNETRSLVQRNEPMLAELNGYHQSTTDGDWSFVFMSRIDALTPLLSVDSETTQPKVHYVAAIVHLAPDALSCTFASDVPIDHETPDAPVDLFDAIAPDSVFTIATARAPSFDVNQQSMSVNLRLASDEDQSSESDSVFNAPALLALSAGDSTSMNVTMCLTNEQRDPGVTARLGDDAIRSFIQGFDPTQAPDMQGRFPDALRQIELRLPQSDVDSTPNWPGTSPSLAWKSVTTARDDLVITCIAPNAKAPAGAIRRIEDSIRTLDALDAQPRKGVLLRVSMDPMKTLNIINDPDLVDIALAKIIQRFELGMRRGIDASVRGRVEIEFSNIASSPTLGKDTR